MEELVLCLKIENNYYIETSLDKIKSLLAYLNLEKFHIETILTKDTKFSPNLHLILFNISSPCGYIEIGGMKFDDNTFDEKNPLIPELVDMNGPIFFPKGTSCSIGCCDFF